MDTAAALERWRSDLAAWAIPREILDRAPASPWIPERATFVRRASASKARPDGSSYRRALEALPGGGSVLDVGAGAGATSLPLLVRAARLIAVDRDEELLRELLGQAGPEGARVTMVLGAWPDIAPAVPVVDVAVCGHVLYNVPELTPFVVALEDHARRRVLIEITARHPLARLNPLWKRFYGIDRPTRPTWEDAARAVEEIRGPVHVERETRPHQGGSGDWQELVEATTRRLCLPRERHADVSAAMAELMGAIPGDPSTWMPDRDLVTIWWDT